MIDNGWVKVHRKLVKNPVWTQLPESVLKVWIGMLLLANFEDTSWYDGVSQVSVPAGSFITSYKSLGSFTNLNTQQVRTAFRHLENLGFVTYRPTYRWTLVTITNWATYQSDESDANKLSNRELTQSQQGANTDLTGSQQQNKKNKNVRREEGKNTPSPADADGGWFGLPGEQSPTEQKRQLTAQQRMWFECFWAAYWLKVSKKPAWETYQKRVKTLELHDAIMAAVKAQSPEMMTREPRKRPHASTWLNQERWTDEVQAPSLAVVVRNGSGQPINREDQRRILFEERMRKEMENGTLYDAGA